MTRSQAILRMPVDLVDATMILHDGESYDALLFIPPSEDVALLLIEGKQFVPVCLRGKEHMVARAQIACLGLAPDRAPKLSEDLPTVNQKVQIKLVSGVKLDGVLHWTAPPGQQRSSDYLDSESPVIHLYQPERVYVIAKAHVAMVTEL